MEAKDIKELTRAEEQVMQAVWKVGQGFANEVVAAVGGNAAYNTVLTVVRILEQKGFVGHETFNRANRYYPLITREEYAQQMVGRLTSSYFGSSARALVSFLVDRKEVSLDDLESLIKEIER